MKKVNRWYIAEFLAPLSGLADEDLGNIKKYTTLDSNNEAQMKQLIRTELKPDFEKYDKNQQDKMKLSLSYYLFFSKLNFEGIFKSLLLPLNTPVDTRQFFVWIWEELFPGENYHLKDADEYVEIDDIWEPLGVRPGPDGKYIKIEDD